MLSALANRISARPRRVLVVAALFTVFAAALGGPVAGLLDASGGFTDRDSDSAKAVERLDGATKERSDDNAILLVRPGGSARSAAATAEVRRLGREAARVPGVSSVASAATTRDPRFVSRDEKATYVAVSLRASADEDAVRTALERRFGDRDGVTLGGALFANDQLGAQISEDLGRAELLAFPLLILLSIVFFRGGRAAILPLVVGASTVLTTFLMLRVVDEFKDLSIFCLNLVIGMGLGLAIDYTLFLLHRYREELERSGPGAKAVRDTMASAGRTVVFSALTVAIALATLLLFPLNFLQSMAIGGAGVALVAALASCVIAPAFFALWNVKLRARDRTERADARWYGIAKAVMRRPGAVTAVTALVMIILALPALRATWTPVDIQTLPEGLSARTVGDALARDFPGQDSSPVQLAVEAGRGDGAQVRALAERVAREPGIASVGAPRSLDGSTWQIEAIAKGDAAGEPVREAVESIRAYDIQLSVLVGGEAADFIDQQSAIGDALVPALLMLAALTFALLWLMTGSVVLPVKALLMNVLTVGATLGVLTLVFQDGRLEGLLGYTGNGGIESTDFLVTATLVFALSTDYGVFLLGRIKEARDRGLSDREAVASGLSVTGSVVTAAAILLAVAIGVFVTSEVLFIKQIGLGVAVGVLIDAFVVRALLVPSLMALLGPWNWWSPKPLRWLHERLGLEEPVAVQG